MARRPPIFSHVNTAAPLLSHPHYLLKLIEITKKNSSQRELARIVQLDPAFCTRLFRLQAAESCMTVDPKNMVSILNRIDVETIRHMALCGAMLQANRPDEGRNHLRFNRFWQHAQRCGRLAHEIAMGMGYAHPEEAFLAGLLHDIGKLLMWSNFPRTYGFYFDQRTNAVQVQKQEQRLLGATHSEIGAFYLHELNLPSVFTDAVRFHHRRLTEIINSLPLVRIVYAANKMVHHDLGPRALNGLAAILSPRLDAPKLAAMRHRAEIKFKATCQFLGLMPTDFTHHHVFNRLEKLYPVRTMLSEVEEMSLVPGLMNRLLKARDQEDARRIFLLGLHILFDIHKALFFRFDSQRRVLCIGAASNGLNGASADGLEIPLRESSNLPSLALINNRILDSFGYFTERDLAIVDKQLAAALGSDGILCVPLQRHRRHLGVIVGGIREVEIPRLAAQMDRLREFADQAAVFMDSRLPEHASTAPAKDHLIMQDSVRRVVHEVNNQLGIIRNYLGTLGGEDDPAPSNLVEMSLIQDQIDRVGQLIERLGRESGKPASVPTDDPVDLNRIISDLDRLLGPSVFRPAKVKVKYHLAADLPPVQGDGNALIQVFLNLFKNAVEAMPHGGNLRIHTACRCTSEDQDRRQILVTVSDTGPGLSSTLPKRLFTPGVTTKNIASSGLGLAIVKDIIEQHKGTVFFQTQRGKGTTVVMLLPTGQTDKHRSSEGIDGETARNQCRG
ncbi:MAG: HDOD domain-containing protein [Desulfobacterales bacterium]|nr:HDOD domain-containing protein [Desulfobacterales bacterium]